MLSFRIVRTCSRPAFAWRASSPLTKVRFISNATAVGNIPAPPPVPVPVLPVVQEPSPILSIGDLPLEPAFRDLGLGGYWPIGIAQSSLEFLHVNLGIPWWATIVTGTICVRLLLAPVFVLSQRNTAKMTNCSPRMVQLQKEISNAKKSDDRLTFARKSQELQMYLKNQDVSPLKNAMLPFVQLPFFISFFIGLRRMANCPVESMVNGGIFWFTDLTMPDQFYILPIMTSVTMWMTIELGLHSANSGLKNAALMKYVMRAIPVVMLPFTIHFSSAILCYWLSTNTVSLIQVALLKVPRIKKALKIPEVVVDTKIEKGKGFIKTAQETWKDMKMTREVSGRQRADEISFNQAGRGPLVKTYKFDPTKVISAKSRNSD